MRAKRKIVCREYEPLSHTKVNRFCSSSQFCLQPLLLSSLVWQEIKKTHTQILLRLKQKFPSAVCLVCAAASPFFCSRRRERKLKWKILTRRLEFYVSFVFNEVEGYSLQETKCYWYYRYIFNLKLYHLRSEIILIIYVKFFKTVENISVCLICMAWVNIFTFCSIGDFNEHYFCLRFYLTEIDT